MGNREEQLVRRFANADLRAVVAENTQLRVAPSGLNSRDIFQMGILGTPRKDRYFNIFPGNSKNRVEVQGVDDDLRQLVLMVHEPVRTFTENIPKGRAEIDRKVVKVVGETNWNFIIERRTDDRKRHFLCGSDERDYFICQLPRPVSTVRQAHEVLKPEVAREKSKKGKVVRQGEWFFMEPSRLEYGQLVGLEKIGKLEIYKKMPIGPAYQGSVSKRQRGGNPHTADELVLLRGLHENQVFIRGKVRHVDHATKEFDTWVRIVRNTERVEATTGLARMSGVTWVD
jgi:hypothetical protein